jgi:DNA-binding transcriptional regulator YdaS (Cro superfamily)
MGEPDKNPLVERAIKIVGTQADLAKILGCVQQTVSKMLTCEINVSAEHALLIERETKGQVTVRELCPHLFPRELENSESQVSG